MAGTLDPNNLQGLLQSIAKANADSQNRQSQATAINEDNQKLLTDLMDSTKIVNELKQKQDAIDSQQQLALEATKVAAGKAFGTQMADPENKIAALARERQTTLDNTLASIDRGQQLTDTNLWDDPLQYMLQRPFAHREFAKAEMGKKKIAVLDSAIQNLNSDTQQTLKTQEALNTQFTAAEAEIKGQVVKATADQLIMQARMKKNDALTQNLGEMQKYTAEQLHNKEMGYKAKRQEDEFQLRLAEHNERKSTVAADKLAQKLSLDQTRTAYNEGAKRLGRPQIEKNEEFANIIKMPDTAAVIQFGLPYVIAPAGTPTILAPTIGEAAVTLDALNGRLPDTATKTSEFLRAASAKGAEELKKKSAVGKKLTLEDKAGAINSVVYDTPVLDKEGKPTSKSIVGEVSRMQADFEAPSSLGVENINKAPPPAVIAKSYPAITKEPLWDKIIAPIAAVEPNPKANQVFKQAKLAISAGEVQPEEATMFINRYYAAANQVNRALESYETIGVKGPQGYIAKVDSPASRLGFFTGTAAPVYVDMVDYSKVMRELIWAQKRK